MSHHEKSALGSLFAGLLAWGYLTMRMTDGWALVDASPGHMIWTYGAVVVLLIVVHSVLAGVLSARAGSAAEKDERDLAIAARADRIEGLVVLVGVNALIIQALAHAAFAGQFAPRIDLGTLPGMFYALLTILFLGHFAGRGVTLWLYRA